MINSLHIRNFKGIRGADIGLERLTVIVGPNASGKTSVLEALDILSKLESSNAAGIFRDRRDPTLLYGRDAAGEAMELSSSGPEVNIRLRVVPPPSYSESEAHRITPENRRWNFVVEAQEKGTEGNDWHAIRNGTTAHRGLQPAIFLRLDPSRLASPSIPLINPTAAIGEQMAVKPDGEGMTSALVDMALNQPGEFQHIQQLLKSIVPSIEGIRFERINNGPMLSNSYQILFDFRAARNIPAHLASEGTLLILGLLTAYMTNGQRRLLLVDDIDRALHPKAQREVVDLLRTFLSQNPDLQIVATTHSPYLVDCLRPEEVRLTTLGDDGTVSIASLVEHPDFDKWKDEMAPGEMWSLFGEKWVGELQKDPVEK